MRRIVSFIEVKKEMCATRADIYDAKTDLCLEQRRLQQDACAAQAQMEIEKCRAQFQQELAELRAGVELEKEEVRSQFRERLRSNLALNLDQHVDVGQLQVNTEELKKLIEERDKEHKEAAQIYERLENTRRAQMRENALTEAQKALDSNDVAKAQMIMRNCACGSFVANSDCSQPIADKLTQREAMKEPVKQPILPTEIPLMLPIKISVGMDNPSIQNARVQQLRVREPMKQCQACEQCVAFNPKCPTCNPAIAPVPPESEPAPVVVPPSPPK
ncbi:MAG: hypothetical protein WCJ09_00505 [Planctomycetota bacterium]